MYIRVSVCISTYNGGKNDGDIDIFFLTEVFLRNLEAFINGEREQFCLHFSSLLVINGINAEDPYQLFT